MFVTGMTAIDWCAWLSTKTLQVAHAIEMIAGLLAQTGNRLDQGRMAPVRDQLADLFLRQGLRCHLGHMLAQAGSTVGYFR
jgi:hypothetical protein